MHANYIVSYQIYDYFFVFLGVLNPIVLHNYFANWLLYHWKWSDTQNYPCKLQGHSSFRFPTDHKAQSSIEMKQPLFMALNVYEMFF
jgi:hypothetical protein